MLRSYLSAALGNLGRNWLYAGVTVLGLAVSFAAAILIGLYVHDEYTFERFIPGAERVYRLESHVTLPGQRPAPMVFASGWAARYLQLDFPEVETAARLTVTRAGDGGAGGHSVQLAASAAGVLMAWATVSAHAILVARAKPASALRYE